MSRPALTYLAALLAFGLLDYVWLRHIAIDWYEAGMAHVLAPQPNWWAAGAFYLLYPAGVVFFAAWPSEGDWTRALFLGALFGAFAYGTYDLTSLAVIRDWPVGLTLLDIAWGAVVSGAAAAAGAVALKAAS
ncbi:DUF2177 family protein [Ramlibacter rhizophilus]|uniref:DUF2177 family protein n=1 Tax=Ramlibacter rhizophilus TaxID=1781167 RepID=A0A4Z0BGU8_9BURK|nr:DUF2177 family protein [Ramlibacter rhizophilus]TFY97971.1 DUF2177 family protein [Ramlibacter rhizophilus]